MRSGLFYLAVALSFAVVLCVLAALIAHLPWWGALMLLVFAGWLAAQTWPLVFGVGIASRLDFSEVLPVRLGLLVTAVERCSTIESHSDRVAYWVDLVVTPRQTGDQPAQWEPGQVQVLWAEPATVEDGPKRRRRLRCGSCGEASTNCEVVETLVWGQDGYGPLTSGLLSGEQRLRLKVEVPTTVRRIRLMVGVSWSPKVDLPASRPEPAA